VVLLLRLCPLLLFLQLLLLLFLLLFLQLVLPLPLHCPLLHSLPLLLHFAPLLLLLLLRLVLLVLPLHCLLLHSLQLLLLLLKPVAVVVVVMVLQPQHHAVLHSMQDLLLPWLVMLLPLQQLLLLLLLLWQGCSWAVPGSHHQKKQLLLLKLVLQLLLMWQGCSWAVSGLHHQKQLLLLLFLQLVLQLLLLWQGCSWAASGSHHQKKQLQQRSHQKHTPSWSVVLVAIREDEHLHPPSKHPGALCSAVDGCVASETQECAGLPPWPGQKSVPRPRPYERAEQLLHQRPCFGPSLGLLCCPRSDCHLGHAVCAVHAACCAASWMQPLAGQVRATEAQAPLQNHVLARLDAE
jgi:hypothetical protein